MEIFNNILIYFVIVPLLTLGGLALCHNRGIKAIRTVAVVGASVLMVLAVWLVSIFLQARGAGDTSEMILRSDVLWYAPLNIHLALGVDGISVVMILLSAFIVYLLIGVWGSGNKNYSAMKLTLMLMGGSAFLMLGLIGIYFHSAPEGQPLTMNILDIAHNDAIPHGWQNVLFPLTFVGFGVLGAMFPFHTWSPDGHASAPTAVSMLHAGVLMKLGGYGCFRIAIYLMPYAANECADRPQVHQRLLVGEPLRYGIVRHPDVQHHGNDWCCAADALSRSDDGPLLCPHRYDLWPHPHP